MDNMRQIYAILIKNNQTTDEFIEDNNIKLLWKSMCEKLYFNPSKEVRYDIQENQAIIECDQYKFIVSPGSITEYYRNVNEYHDDDVSPVLYQVSVDGQEHVSYDINIAGDIILKLSNGHESMRIEFPGRYSAFKQITKEALENLEQNLSTMNLDQFTNFVQSIYKIDVPFKYKGYLRVYIQRFFSSEPKIDYYSGDGRNSLEALNESIKRYVSMGETPAFAKLYNVLKKLIPNLEKTEENLIGNNYEDLFSNDKVYGKGKNIE